MKKKKPVVTVRFTCQVCNRTYSKPEIDIDKHHKKLHEAKGKQPLLKQRIFVNKIPVENHPPKVIAKLRADGDLWPYPLTDEQRKYVV